MPRWPRAVRSETDEIATLGGALKAFLRSSGLDSAARQPQFDAAWRKIVGPEIIAHTRVLGFRKGTLEVGVDSSALMNEIRFHRAALLADLKREIPRPALIGISFSLTAIQEDDERPAET